MQMNYHQISDYHLAVTLITIGFKLHSIDRTKPRAEFCFEPAGNISESISAYWNDELTVNPKVLFVNHKLLKSRLFAEQK